MSLLKKKNIGKGKGADAETYIDLGKMTFDDEGAALGSGGTRVKVAEVYGYEDVFNLTSQIYGGHLLIIDYNAIAKDEDGVKRIQMELKSVVDEIGGDVAGIGHNMILVTPKGISIDRSKIRGSYGE